MTNNSAAISRDKTRVTKLTITAMLTAVAAVLQYIEVPVPFVPAFLKFDFSDLPELIGAFVIGPMWGVVICLLKNLIHLPFGSSVGAGEFANFLLGSAFVFTAGMIYKHNKTKKGALIACISGAAIMAAVSVPLNYFIVYPIYAQLWVNGDMNIIVSMYKDILPYSDNLIKSLLIFNVPFTIAKGILVSVVTMLIYKPLSNFFVKLNNTLNKSNSKKPETVA